MQYFKEHREEFDEHYHLRSNVESTDSAVKRLLGHITPSIQPTARVNEVLAKAVAYNISRVVHATYTDGITPFFGS